MPNDPDALASALFDFAGDAVIAAMQVEDRALVPVSGQADELAALETASRDWVADLIDDEGALARHLAGEGVLFLDAADGGSQSIMLAAFGSTRILALVESRALPRLYGFWDRL